MHTFRLVALALIALGIEAPRGALAQVPPDLDVIGIAGSIAADDTNNVVRILAGGEATFERFVSGQPNVSTIDSTGFSLTPSEVEQLWDAIQLNGFFGLEESYEEPSIGDRTFAQLLITANSTSWMVTTQNVAVPEFDNIMAVLNALTPGDDDLVYDTSPPITFTPQDVCDGSLLAPFGPKASGKGETQAYAPAPERGGERSALAGDSNPGTRVAYHITLQEAVERGVASLSGKGGFFGDQVSITVDNSSCETSDSLKLTLNLELYGPGASSTTESTIRGAIVGAWGGFMTGGKSFGVNVKTRRSTDTSAPGTAGFHQVQVDSQANIPTSFVSGRGSSFHVNTGTGSASWRTTGSALTGMYAHEAGHFFEFPDRYDDYRQQPDSSWKRRSDGDVKSSAQLATLMMPSNPGASHAQILAWLNRSTVRRATFPFAGSENDIMADKTKSVQQSDIDSLAAKAGLVVEVRPGDILVNKDGTRQNFVITRSVDMFVHKGKMQTLNGLFVACIDAHESIPSLGGLFDVSPPLSEWVGIEAAQTMQALLDYVDPRDLFCTSFFPAQEAIWRISDNEMLGSSASQQLLIDAGIDIGSQILDFPRLTNPNAGEPTTTTVVPPELYVLAIASASGDLVQVGQLVQLDAGLSVPTGGSMNFTFAWTLTPPAGSSATLSDPTGLTTSFTPDVRGFYAVTLRVDIDDGGSAHPRASLLAPFSVEEQISLLAADPLTETFETGTLEAAPPFTWVTDDPLSWIVESESPHTGDFAAHSATITGGQTTSLEVTIGVNEASTVAFAYRVSSEANFDFLMFYVDDVLRESWSGEIGWSIYSTPLTPGSHTLRWTYLKDGSISSGVDRAWIDDVLFPGSAMFVAVEDPITTPRHFSLAQNRPNPFSGGTVITYALPAQTQVRLVVYDMAGREVAVLAEGPRGAGEHQVQLDAGRLPPGVYTYRLKAGSFSETKRMVLLR